MREEVAVVVEVEVEVVGEARRKIWVLCLHLMRT
jgi:hypothetical protein